MQVGEITIGVLPEGRFILSLLGMLSADLHCHSIRQLVHSNVLALSKTIHRLAVTDNTQHYITSHEVRI